MLKQDNEPHLIDSTDLTDADWDEINKIKQAYATRGQRGFVKALEALYKRDELTWLRVVVVLAYYPTVVKEAMRDNMAASAVTAENLQDIFENMESSPTKH
jgi:hypothetical protein